MSIQLRGRARTTRRSIASLFAGLAMLLGLVVAQGVNAPSASAGGGYPYDHATDCSAQFGVSSWCINGKDISPYTYGYRNCTDYVAAKVASMGVPADKYKYLGHAKNWGTNAAAKGVTVNGTPFRGSAAVRTSGDFGHVAYVEEVHSNGTITVSEYNRSWDGNYGTRTGTPSALGFTQFVHFEAFMANGGVSSPTETRPTVSNTVPWSFTNLDGDSGSLAGQQGDIGRGAAAVEYQGSLQVFYYDATGGNLRHAWKGSSGTWNFETLDGAGGGSGRRDADLGQNPSVAVYGTSIQVFYYDATNGNLRHAFASLTSGWQFENLDGDAGSIGGQNASVGVNSEVTVMNGVMHVFYPNSSSGNLRRAWHDSTGWHFHNLDGDAGSIAGQYGSYAPQVGASIAATVQGGKVQVFYYDATNDNLRHAWYNGSTWGFETLDGDAGSISGHTGSVGQNPSVAATSDGLQVFYYDASGGNLRHAWTSSTVGWQFENLDGPSSSIGPNRHAVGLYSSVHVVNGDVKVFYFDNRWTNLRQAWASPTTGWQFENLDGLGGGPAGRTHMDVGSFPFLTYFGGKWHGFYYDIYGGNLRLATPQ